MSESEKTWRQWAADPSIDFWDVSEDTEELTHEALEEAVESYVDENSALPDDVPAWVRNCCADGLKIYGFRRKVVDEKWLEGLAQVFAERFVEDHWTEEYGDPHDADRDTEAELAAALLDAMKRSLPEPWQCERVATVTIPLDELLAALREWRPDWFEVAP